MASIKFYCRECRTGKDNLAPIEMALNINGKRVFIPMPLKCAPEDFSKAIKKIDSPISKYCSKALENVEKIMTEMMDNGEELTADSLKNFLKQGCVKKTYTLENLFTEYLSILNKRVGSDMSKDTYNRYEKTTRMFMEDNSLKGETPANAITKEHVLKYQAALLSRLDPATACNYLQKIKTIFKYGFENGKMNHNPASMLKIDKGIKDTILYLTPEELQKIKNKNFVSPRLSQVKDVFLFCCYTGLAYADVAALTPEDFKSKGGQWYIDKKRTKTGVGFFTILLPAALDIAKRKNFNFHVLSNQKMNAYLKEIQDMCEIETNLSTHVARHTAASLFLNFRPAIPMQTICRVFGWTNEKQAHHYAKIFGNTILEDVAGAFGLDVNTDIEKYDISPAEPQIITSKKGTHFNLVVKDVM